MLHPRSILLSSTLAVALTSAVSAQTWDTTRPPNPDTFLNYTASIAYFGDSNQIYVFGGQTETQVQDGVRRYHRITHWSSPLGLMPGKRTNAASATALDGFAQEKIYLFGGSKPVNTIADDTWEYDPLTDTWDTTLTSMPTPRKKHTAVTGADGEIYVFGGRNAGGSRLATVESYDPATDTWTTWPSMAVPRDDFGAVAACDGFIYIFGGETNSGQTASVEVFEPGVGFVNNPHTLFPCTPMPTVRADMGCAIGRDRRIYLVGGSINSVVPTASVVSYDPITDTWDFEDDLPTNRSGLAALGMGSRVYALGGYRKIWPYTGKVNALGILPSWAPCGGVVPPLPPEPFGDITMCDAAVSWVDDNYVTDIGIDNGFSNWFEIHVLEQQTLKVFVANHEGDDTGRCNLWGGCGLGLLGMSQGTGTAGEQILTYHNDTGAPITVSLEYTWAGDPGEHLTYDIQVQRSFEAIGTNYCDPAVPNSTGKPGLITASGDTIVDDNDFTLHATDLPKNQIGYFIASENQGFVQNPGGAQGNLCLGAPIARFNAFIDTTGPNGQIDLTVDLWEFPTNPQSIVQPGQTWNFQLWYRDKNPTNTSNFTNGLSVLFE